jgi:hypothetical protein
MSTSDPTQQQLKAVLLLPDHAMSQRPLLAADHKKSGPKLAFKPAAPLCWWYKPDQEVGEKRDLPAWRRIPADALDETEPNFRVVRLLADRLERPPGWKRAYFISVTDHGAAPEDDGFHYEVGDGCDVVADPPPPQFRVQGRGSPGEAARPVAVRMSRTFVPQTRDEILWMVIRNSTDALGFDAYQSFMDGLFSHPRLGYAGNHEKSFLAEIMHIPGELFTFSSVDAYRVLKAATEVFVMSHCGVVGTRTLYPDALEEEGRFNHNLPEEFQTLWDNYLTSSDKGKGNGTGNGNGNGSTGNGTGNGGGNGNGLQRILPYLHLIRRKLGDVGTGRSAFAGLVDQQAGLLQDKLAHPCLLELIWSYWMEEGMLVQSFNSITRRFQNLRASGERDPLAQLELDPLRPLNNLMWGWVQDEQSQLSVLRRAHEYDHQYGFTLHGKALAELRTADRRSKFLESFHNLLWKCAQFYRQDDDTTVIADGFAILNALKETHYLLAHGAHNQFGNLPSTARQEMLMQQWILSRGEMREFLGGRVMVPYPEAWMDRVDAVKTLKSWTNTSVVHFRDLAVFGEQILLSVRWGAWSTVNNPDSAANWARYWRAEVQGYIHAYRAATSVDLTTDITDQRQAETRFLSPSVHLRNRLLSQVSR